MIINKKAKNGQLKRIEGQILVNCLFLLILLKSLLFFSCKNKIEPDNIPPQVRITYPIDKSTVSEIVKITCVASDNEGIKKVCLWVDGKQVEGSEDNSEPYELLWNTTGYDNGSYHTITIRAIDKNNNTTDSELIILYVDNSKSYPQKINIISISFANNSFKVGWEKSPDLDFHSYTLYQSLFPDMRSKEEIFNTIIHDTTTFTVLNVDLNETRYYQIVVTDTIGLKTDSDVKVGSSVVTAKIISPQNNSKVSEIVKITCETETTEGIEKIELMVDNLLIEGSEDTNEPYEFYLNTSKYANGSSHEFTLKLSDKNSNTKYCDTINVIIDNTMYYPTKIDLSHIKYQDNSFNIKWLKSSDSDFHSYTLLESMAQDMSSEKEIFFTTNRNDTTYTVQNVNEGETRYYQLVVADTIGLKTLSSIKTADAWPFPTNGLIAYYPFNDNANDESGNENYGTVYGAILTEDRFGNQNSAYSFDGVDDYIDIGNDLSLKPKLPITFAAWIKVNKIGESIFWNNNEKGRFCGIHVVTGIQYESNLIIGTGDGGISSHSSRRSKIGTTNLKFGTWYHIVGVICGPIDMDIYINGKNDGGIYDGTGGSMAYTNETASIGRSDSSPTYPPNYFNGVIDEIYFYNRALSEQEIKNLYEN